MLPDDSRHGTYAGAIAHWKGGEKCCETCGNAARIKRKKNALAALEGRPGMVELGPAFNIIRDHPRNQLVAATGYTHERLRRYELAGPGKRVHRTTRDRILAAAKPAWTPIGVQRRLQALAALGWSGKALGDQIGSHATTMNALRRRKNPQHVRLHFAEKVIALYAELCMTLPPTGMSATECRNEAQRRGWLPPLAWDDDTIDDPEFTPIRSEMEVPSIHKKADPVVVERFLSGDRDVPTVRAERELIVADYIRNGRPLADLERCGWKPERYILISKDGAA